MEKFDVLVIGAATSGAFFAHKMAEKGFSVKLIDCLPEEKVGTKYDIFHIPRVDFGKFDIPRPYKGDIDWAFEYTDGYTISPFGNHSKHSVDNVVGMHMHEYTLRLNRWAENAGAEIEYGCAFDRFIIENERISGIVAKTAQGEKEIYARVVVDCAGAENPARRSLPENYGVETFKLQDDDKFYVTLKYINFKDEKDYINGTCACPFYKTWTAPQPDKTGAILGVGSCRNYEYGEEILQDYLDCVPLGEHTVSRIERGTTPYCRCPYSFVADGFIVSGDAACLTKPLNGEGVTSSMVHMEIACDVLEKALKEDGYVTKEKLWAINTIYNKKQGADFVTTRALLINAVKIKKEEFEYVFGILPEAFLQNPENIPGFKVPVSDYKNIAAGVVKGLASGRISKETFELLKRGLVLGMKLKLLYLVFPDSPKDFDEWCEKADELWKQVGKMQ